MAQIPPPAPATLGAKVKFKIDNEWIWLTQQASAHPKTAICISLVIGAVAGFFIGHM